MKYVKLAEHETSTQDKSVKYTLEALDRQFKCLSNGTALPDLKRARYVAPDNLWTHDHCILCSNVFSEDDDGGKGTEGWIVNDPGPSLPMKSNVKRDLKPGQSLRAPENVRDWMCLDCKEIISAWSTGTLVIQITGHQEIGRA